MLTLLSLFPLTVSLVDVGVASEKGMFSFVNPYFRFQNKWISIIMIATRIFKLDLLLNVTIFKLIFNKLALKLSTRMIIGFKKKAEMTGSSWRLS